MAITTDSRQGIVISGVRVSEIGLSKTLNNYTLDELFQSTYCGEHDVLRENNHISVADESFSEGNPDFNYPLTYVSGNWADGGDVANYTDPDGLYGKVIWLYNTGTFDNYITTSRLSNYKLVTEWEVNKFLTVIPQTFNRGPCNASLCPSSWDQDKPFPAIYYTPGLVISAEYHTHYGFPDDAGVAVDIKPYIITKFNGIYFIYAFNMLDTLHYFYACEGPKVFAQGGIASPGEEVTLASVISVDYFSATETGNFTYAYYPGDNGIPFRYPLGTYSEIIRAMVSKDKKYLSSWKTGGTVESMFAGLVVCKYLTKRQDALMFYANCGIRFYAGTKLYKPIIEEGIVTGFTDDLSAPSDIDNWNGSSIHDIPDSPGGGGGGGDEDDFDDHEMGAGTGISGMANLWLLTKSQLSDLHGAFNSAPGGFDPMNSLISVMGLGVAPTYLFNDIEVITPINIRKSDGTSWSTGVEGHIVDAQKSAFQFTGITVNRKYNNFLDFSPYAIHEIFIPMCGWLTLPDIAVDRSITVTYLPDVESLKCRAVVSVVDNSGHRCVIGEKEGIMGADVPFTNTGHSLYVGEAIINGMNVAGEVITGAIGAGFTKTNAKGGTYRPYEGFTVGMGGTLPGAIGNALVSGQTNRTHYMTGNGTRIGFSDGENIQIKSTYHNIDKPSNYDHTVGKVCNKTGTLSEFHGFTVCDNPHIHISALEEEKSEIKALLEQGVILPSGE